MLLRGMPSLRHTRCCRARSPDLSWMSRRFPLGWSASRHKFFSFLDVPVVEQHCTDSTHCAGSTVGQPHLPLPTVLSERDHAVHINGCHAIGCWPDPSVVVESYISLLESPQHHIEERGAKQRY